MVSNTRMSPGRRGAPRPTARPARACASVTRGTSDPVLAVGPPDEARAIEAARRGAAQTVMDAHLRTGLSGPPARRARRPEPCRFQGRERSMCFRPQPESRTARQNKAASTAKRHAAPVLNPNVTAPPFIFLWYIMRGRMPSGTHQPSAALPTAHSSLPASGPASRHAWRAASAAPGRLPLLAKTSLRHESGQVRNSPSSSTTKRASVCGVTIVPTACPVSKQASAAR